MKALVAAFAVLAATLALQTATFAQNQKAPTYRYCLVDRSSGSRGGGEVMLCRFNTMEQCMAGKTGNSDSCIINPELTEKK